MYSTFRSRCQLIKNDNYRKLQNCRLNLKVVYSYSGALVSFNSSSKNDK